MMDSQKICSNSIKFAQLLLITQQPQNWLVEMDKFSFLKQQVKKQFPQLNSIYMN